MNTDFRENSWGLPPTELLKSIANSANAVNKVEVSPYQQMDAFKLNFENVRNMLQEVSGSLKSSIGSIFGTVPEKQKMLKTVDDTFAKYEKEIYSPNATFRVDSPRLG